MSTEMAFNEYQVLAATTAIYPESGTGSALALAYVGLGLGEAGEIQNKIKKVIRDSGGTLTDQMRADLVKEYGDLLWYVANGLSELGVQMSDAARGNIEKLFSRKDRGVLGGSGDDR